MVLVLINTNDIMNVITFLKNIVVKTENSYSDDVEMLLSFRCCHYIFWLIWNTGIIDY